MYIKIDLKTIITQPELINFSISLPALEKAMDDCYLGIGTPYEPIEIDNFVTIGKFVFPTIEPKSQVSISLDLDSDDYKYDPQLVCCTVKNVGKVFTDKNFEIKDYWKNIFDYDKKWVQNAPDGTLYISPNTNDKCVISTKEGPLDDYVSYSIMFSMVLKDSENHYRRYYFVLDPLVKISSRGGTFSTENPI